MGKFDPRRATHARPTQGVNVIEGSRYEPLEAAGYVEFAATGDEASGAFQCAECGYGVAVQRVLPLCPMCGGTAWEHAFVAPAEPLQ
jgi:rubrerythrin